MKAEMMEKLKGEFWTHIEELFEDLESKGLDIADYNGEAIEVFSEEDEKYYTVHLIVAGSTIAIQDIE